MQAVGAGILAPLALATTALVFPPAQRGLGLAMMAVVANVAAALGPPIGGVLVELAGWPWDAGWHWIFLINVPIGVLGIALALRVMPETRDPHAGTEVDWWGMATLGGRVFCLTFGLVEGNRRGWGSPLIVWLFVAVGAAGGRVRAHAALRPLPDADARRSSATGSSWAPASACSCSASAMMGTLFMTVLAVREPLGLLGAGGGAGDHAGGADGDARVAARGPLLATGSRRASSACRRWS